MTTDAAPIKLSFPGDEADFDLPPLREDIHLYKGPKKTDGSPTWSLHDPVNNRFFRIGWLEFELLVRWKAGKADKLVEEVNSETTLHVGLEHAKDLVAFLATNQLLQARSKQAIDELYEKAMAGRKHLASWLLQNYLFLRIPLVRPDSFLTHTLPYIRFVFSRGFFQIVLVATFLGLYLVTRQWESFEQTFMYFFTLEGLVLFAVAIFLAKVIHELGHAYTAKYYGVRVPTMGIALLVLWPVLYTDTSEAWKLPDRRQRLSIAAAGMKAELALASFATLLWSFLPDGPLRASVFMIATTTWVVTLLINLNPFMRFDGYYLLSDLLEVQNLQDRSFALGKWKLRQWILGINDPPPENFPPHLNRLLLTYAYCTWVYRFFLFLGIALLVYFFFFKAAGVFLMITELVWFIARPVYKELNVWYEMRQKLRWNRNTLISTIFILFFLFLLIYPMETSVRIPAVLKYSTYTRIHAPDASTVKQVHVRTGDQVDTGQPLITLESPELEYKTQQAQRRVRLLQEQLLRQTAHAQMLDISQVVQQQLAEALTQLQGLAREQEQLNVTAPYSATVVQWDDDIQPGRWINDRLRLGLLVDKASTAIQGYVKEQDLARLTIGNYGRFFADEVDLPPIQVKLTAIDKVNADTLVEPYLASVYDGPVPVNETDSGELVSITSQYRLHLTLQNSPYVPPQIIRGTVYLDGKPESLLHRIWLFVSAVIIRESSF